MINKRETKDKLKEFDFKALTQWEIRKDKIKPTTIDWDNCSGWIYAFVVHSKVRYVGITTAVLRSRLFGYSYQINDPVGAKIRKLLDIGTDVSIYGTKRPGKSKFELENEESKLINLFDTDWNVRR